MITPEWPTDVQDGDILTVHVDACKAPDAPWLQWLGRWVPVREIPADVLRRFGVTVR